MPGTEWGWFFWSFWCCLKLISYEILRLAFIYFQLQLWLFLYSRLGFFRQHRQCCCVNWIIAYSGFSGTRIQKCSNFLQRMIKFEKDLNEIKNLYLKCQLISKGNVLAEFLKQNLKVELDKVCTRSTLFKMIPSCVIKSTA